MQRAEILHHTVLIEKGVLAIDEAGLTDDLPCVVDIVGDGMTAAQCSQVTHYTVLIKKGVGGSFDGYFVSVLVSDH